MPTMSRVAPTVANIWPSATIGEDTFLFSGDGAEHAGRPAPCDREVAHVARIDLLEREYRCADRLPLNSRQPTSGSFGAAAFVLGAIVMFASCWTWVIGARRAHFGPLENVAR